ncbi:RNA polymerase sigma factor [Arcticibacterium luteifluviistationis]|uniref:RNA polymerase subunit sigma-24 n=1 Tax=Arcticibacterium luteifluviistationis TaxID=1784714 RepID=A0A2Z4GGF9_9BACT|nr:sigma-70 family RNA polymerase sigma factor [Arcticibacterium luteifluviistationis]AWW00029.1 RNA polymerase subunit sigma-24 [Arcticibacterium luteifluviistationis]
MATKTNRYSEDELVGALKKNQRHAFEYLYDNYSSALFGVISRIIPDEEKAADLLQEVFLKIWKKIGDYEPSKAKLYTWMMNIARNASIDLYRKEKNKYHVDIEDQIGLIDESKQGQISVNTIDLRGIVDKLKPERKVLLDLVYLQGYTQQEAAEKLDIPLGTAKSRIRTALQDLKLYYAA